MNQYSATCNCGHEIEFEHEGPRKPGVWLIVLNYCPVCNQGSFCRIYEGKRPNKMQEKTEQIQTAILATFEKEGRPLTIRRLFYVLANRYQLVTKNKAGYRTVQNQTVEMRRAGSIPYHWIADNSRWVMRPRTYSDVESFLQETHAFYRRDLWNRQKVYVEFWIEKDSMAGVISPITEKYGVPLYVARGFSSLTLIHQAAEEIKSIGKPTYIYQFGDFDQSGFQLAEAVPRELEQEHGVKVNFERIAITKEQIEKYNLPLRPADLGKVKRSKNWPYSYAVDLDAMEAPILRRLAEQAIIQHIEPIEWEAAKEIERCERETLNKVRQAIPFLENLY